MTMHNPAHPGAILAELIFEPLGITVTSAAKHLGVSRKTLSKVLNGGASITPEMAVRLELVFEKPAAEHWLNVQNAFDLWHARQNTSRLETSPFRIVENSH